MKEAARSRRGRPREARRAGAGAPSAAKATGALRKLVGNVTSIKCSAAMDGRNTVHTAALMADAVLGDAFVRSSASTRRAPGTWPAIICVLASFV